MENGKKLYLYPLWLRIWHGINALGILVLIFSGISLHYSTRGALLLRFDIAIAVHNIAGVIITFNYFIFILGNILTKNGQHYRVKVQGLPKRLMKQILYYTSGMFKGESSPYPVTEKRKFNPLQKYSYIFVMYIFLPALIVTGIALLFPEMIIEKVFRISGVMITAVLHGILGFFVFLFLLIHLYVASMGKPPGKNYKSILTGWHS
ncbi:thiosulfate reductase cytochrome b subunit [Mariniphaga anaerophila]|uniref:Thiosulfate reductase cytochrome b subunit n=1 Tax=Mariniphaga anaerophila TaxID=1484053 RepID=A0A1M5CVB5_9BACT|nr:cytochrome b/b6 domain-containing protein [Mariniphaga anaerophila]SHF58685.1 thiosulfate reductase cytochrome b subunit [Mariniphaga anaerophila]